MVCVGKGLYKSGFLQTRCLKRVIRPFHCFLKNTTKYSFEYLFELALALFVNIGSINNFRNDNRANKTPKKTFATRTIFTDRYF